MALRTGLWARVRVALCALVALALTGISPGVSAGTLRPQLKLAGAGESSIVVDRIAYEALRRIGYNATFYYTTMESAVNDTNDGFYDGLCGQWPGIEADHLSLLRVPVSLFDTSFTAYSLSGNPITIESWADLQGLRVGTTLKRVMINRNLPKTIASHLQEQTWAGLIDALRAGKCDVIVAASDFGADFLPGDIRLAGVMETDPCYLYLNAAHADLIPKLTHAMGQIRADGTLERLILSRDEPGAKVKSVLHLSSYSSELTWEQQILSGLTDAFRDRSDRLFHTVDLNAYRVHDEATRSSAALGAVRTQLISAMPSAIVVSGAEALDFATDYAKILFGHIPILYCGVDEATALSAPLPRNVVGGAVGHLSAYETVEQMLALFPETREIYVINDASRTGVQCRSEIEAQLEPLIGRVALTYSPEMTKQALFDTVEALRPGTLILSGSYAIDANNDFLTQYELQQRLAGLKVPVFGLISSAIGFGQLGGKYLSGYDQGLAGGRMAMALLDAPGDGSLDGPRSATRHIETPGNRWVFDWDVMTRFGIARGDLPPDADILNRPRSLRERDPALYRAMLIAAAAALVLIASLSAFLIVLKRHNLALLRARGAEAKANRLKSQFLMNMGHEIRTPMNAIIGIAQLAKPGDGAAKLNTDIARMRDAAQHLLRILDNVLDMSLIEDGKLTLKRAPVNLTELMRVLADMSGVEAECRGIHVALDMAGVSHPVVETDAARLGQVVMNLLNNAVKFSHEGGQVTLTVREAEPGQYLFSVKDDGIGIAPERMDCLFIPFEQVDASITRRYGGAGLGLPISRNIVEQMGGEMTAQSAPGAGSTFSFTVPLKPVAQETPEAPAAGAVDLRALKALVVDDVEINRMIAASLLTELGVRVEEAEDGMAACRMIEAAAEGAFDLVFMDVQMPVMDGLSATRAIRAMNRADVKTLKIIAMTANVLPEDIATAMAAGMDAHIGKPIDLGVIVETLNRVFAGR